jgi:RimJ/RimL family protein N-acetyltransferase
LERVYCGTSDTNIGMQKLAVQMGMVEEGRRRKHLFLNGRWEDMVEFGVLREDFRGLSRAVK